MSAAEPLARDVRTTMKYVVRGEKATFHAGDRSKSYWPVDEHPVTIHDMRPIADQLAFDRNGFVLVDEPTDVTDFTAPAEVARYSRQVEALAPRRPTPRVVSVIGAPGASLAPIATWVGETLRPGRPFAVLGKENCTVAALRAQARDVDVSVKPVYNSTRKLGRTGHAVTSGEVLAEMA